MEKLRISGNYDNIEWDKVIKILMAYAYVLIGDKNQKMLISRIDLAYDYTMEAITKFLDNPSKFDPSRNDDLVQFLKYNYLRQIISNHKKTGDCKFEYSSSDLVQDGYISQESFIHEFQIDEKLDVDKIISVIEERLVTDKELKELFHARYHHNSTRSEICEDKDISTNEYDNRMKRLRRIVSNVLKTSYYEEEGE